MPTIEQLAKKHPVLAKLALRVPFTLWELISAQEASGLSDQELERVCLVAASEKVTIEVAARIAAAVKEK
jgi:hypothetical protein